MTERTYSIPLYRCFAQRVRDMGKNSNAISWLIREYMPSGSGIDSSIGLDGASTPKRLVFVVPFHKMHSNGFYCGWTEFRAIVTPSLESEFDLRITGRDYNGIKDHLYEIIRHALESSADAFGYERKEREAA